MICLQGDVSINIKPCSFFLPLYFSAIDLYILTRGEITAGRLNVGGNSLDSLALTWFEKHSGVRVAIYSSDGSLLKRSVIID